ncbi:EF-hand domain-containing protein 1 [Nothobranchius furzeri]|uniref:EF-hand domain-containing protein 1 n=1 Tax=Nothobranchius furzeri TaxID=105023 RepID=UPI00390468C9
MAFNWNNYGIPFLPGYSFREERKSSFHLPQTLIYKNGFALPRRPSAGIGQEPLVSEQLSQQEISELSFEKPDLTYHFDDKTVYEDFIPAYVKFDKKVLCFFAYFLEDVWNSPDEDHRIRHVVIYYYLEDDSMCIWESAVMNSGISQGKRLKRHRVPKNDRGDYYHWKDFNLGIDLEVYGYKYHLTHCDTFTKDFMEHEGIVLNEPEPMPEDPYIKHRQLSPPPRITSPTPDITHRFLTMDLKVLRFYALYDKSDTPYEDPRPMIIYYYLVDDTVEISEVHEHNSGWNPSSRFLRRQKIPKKLKSETAPSCIMELTKKDVEEYYSPKDFQLGQKVTLLNHHFLLYNCDAFTKDYYQKNFPDMEMKPTEIPVKKESPIPEKHIPPYNGFGSLEDSLQNCLSLIPKRPKGNLQKMLKGDTVLRYSARLDSVNPEDEGRQFVMSYFLLDDTISIFEKPVCNSGFIGGKFLRKTCVPKPGSSVEKPEFYSPVDFAIGATVEVLGHRFVLTGAAPQVLKYLESISSKIPSHTLDSLRHTLGEKMAENQPDEQNGEEPKSSPT